MIVKHDFRRINRLISLVEKNILNKFPECNYTTTVTLWNDGTSMIRCKHGTDVSVHCFTYYNDELSYEEIETDDSTIMTIDEFGTEYYFDLIERKK